MKISNRHKTTLQSMVKLYGQDALEAEIRSSDYELPSALTIVANAGLHPIPADFIFGEMYIASKGNLNFDDISSVKKEISLILRRLRKVLKSRRWSKIYLIPFGHSVVSINIKMAVFRTLRIETIDVFYLGEGKYDLLELDTRVLMLT